MRDTRNARVVRRCRGQFGLGDPGKISGRYKHAQEEGGGRGAGLTPEEVGELPCHEFEEEGAGGGGECAVCMEAFRAGDRCRVLPRCGHGFHAECVDSWLRKSRRCPLCRAEAADQRKEGAGTVAVVTESGR